MCVFFCVWLLMGILLLFGIVRKNKRMVLFRVVITAALLSRNIYFYKYLKSIKNSILLCINLLRIVLGTIGQIGILVVVIKKTGFEGATAGGMIGGIIITGKICKQNCTI